jgi:hypothetical protein
VLATANEGRLSDEPSTVSPRMGSVFACDGQSLADRNNWRELKRHIGF